MVLYTKKVCPGCRLRKDYSEYGPNRAKKDGLQTYCHECKRSHELTHYRKSNKIKRLDGIDVRRHNNRIWFNEYRKNLLCIYCGFNDFRALQFHHKDPISKTYNVSEMVGQGLSKRLIIKEISKCEIVCANCHQIKHYEERRIIKAVVN